MVPRIFMSIFSVAVLLSNGCTSRRLMLSQYPILCLESILIGHAPEHDT